MRIAFDAKRATHNNTGLGNYSRLAVETLAQYYPGNSYLLFTPAMLPNPRLDKLKAMPDVQFHTPRNPLIGGSLWRTFSIADDARRCHADIFHGLSGELPVNIARQPFPSVVTIHDLIFRRLPALYKPIDRTIYNYKFRRACRQATRIIAISECTARDIQHFYGIPDSKIDIVYQGCDPQFLLPHTPSEIEAIRSLYHLPGRYIVSVGTIESRKNQLLPLQALTHLPDDIHLVLIGRRTPYADQLERYAAEHSLSSRLHILSGIPFPHLPLIYAGAILSSYTSVYEGFGIPVIESLSAGTPCIVATGSCLEEAGGPDTPAVAPHDAGEFADIARQIILSPPLRKSIVDSGRSYITRFSPENMAAGIMNTYLRALS